MGDAGLVRVNGPLDTMRAALKNDPSATALVATGGSGRPICAGLCLALRADHGQPARGVTTTTA